MSLSDELERLQRLYERGTLSADEFARAKADAFAAAGTESPGGPTSTDVERRTREWAMYLHLSQFAMYAVPLAGSIVPILIWQIKKDELPGIDVHGRIVANWTISWFIYSVASVLLTLLLIGFVTFGILMILAIVFPIVGAIKANNGEAWPYPTSIRFF